MPNVKSMRVTTPNAGTGTSLLFSFVINGAFSLNSRFCDIRKGLNYEGEAGNGTLNAERSTLNAHGTETAGSRRRRCERQAGTWRARRNRLATGVRGRRMEKRAAVAGSLDTRHKALFPYTRA